MIRIFYLVILFSVVSCSLNKRITSINEDDLHDFTESSYRYPLADTCEVHFIKMNKYIISVNYEGRNFNLRRDYCPHRKLDVYEGRHTLFEDNVKYARLFYCKKCTRIFKGMK